jgi:hypothetical protein
MVLGIHRCGSDVRQEWALDAPFGGDGRWQTDEQPTYEFCVPRSLAISFWHWLTTAAAEYGLDLVGANT